MCTYVCDWGSCVDEPGFRACPGRETPDFRGKLVRWAQATIAADPRLRSASRTPRRPLLGAHDAKAFADEMAGYREAAEVIASVALLSQRTP